MDNNNKNKDIPNNLKEYINQIKEEHNLNKEQLIEMVNIAFKIKELRKLNLDIIHKN